MASTDKYFRETVIKGGSILSPLSAQPILRQGGCSAILSKKAHTCSLRSADKDESRMRRRDSAGDHMIFLFHSLLTTAFPVTCTNSGSTEARLLLLAFTGLYQTLNLSVPD